MIGARRPEETILTEVDNGLPEPFTAVAIMIPLYLLVDGEAAMGELHVRTPMLVGCPFAD
jgi:hypothetical protein